MLAETGERTERSSICSPIALCLELDEGRWSDAAADGDARHRAESRVDVTRARSRSASSHVFARAAETLTFLPLLAEARALAESDRRTSRGSPRSLLPKQKPPG